MPKAAVKNEVKREETAFKKEKTPVICLAVSGLSSAFYDSTVRPLVEGLHEIHVRIAVLERKSDDIPEDADMIVFFSPNEEMLKKAWEQGVVPITDIFDSAIEDYNPNSEVGNAFIYKSKNAWAIYAAIIRAVETFKFPYDWKYIMRSCMKSA